MSEPFGYYDTSLPPELWETPPLVGAAAGRPAPDDEQVELEVAVGEPGEQGVVESDPASPIPGEVVDLELEVGTTGEHALPEVDETSSAPRTAPARRTTGKRRR